jgi:hypothetical protein
MRHLRGALLLLMAVLVVPACGAAIGDSCSSDSQCPSGSYCDRTMPGGYCTTMNCRPDDCPDGSVCAEFPNGESYCMDRCSDDGDCRDDYQCITSIGLWPFCSVEE